MVEAIEKRVDKLEDRIGADEDKAAERDEKFNNLLFELKITMTNLNNKLESFSDVKVKIDALETRIKCLEESGKINWFELVKNGLITFLAGGGLIYIVLEVLGKIK